MKIGLLAITVAIAMSGGIIAVADARDSDENCYEHDVGLDIQHPVLTPFDFELNVYRPECDVVILLEQEKMSGQEGDIDMYTLYKQKMPEQTDFDVFLERIKTADRHNVRRRVNS